MRVKNRRKNTFIVHISEYQVKDKNVICSGVISKYAAVYLHQKWHLELAY